MPALNTRIIDQYVDRTLALFQLLNRVADLGAIGNIKVHAQCVQALGAQLLRGPLGVRRGRRRHDNAGAIAAEAAGQQIPNPPGTAGD
ncbi:hypothetical protein SODG_004085 [Sodalis praecaptivus]